MANHSIDFETKQRIITDMLSGMRMKDINKKYGLSHSLIALWRKQDTEFQTAYKEATETLKQASFDKLKELANKAVETMEELLESEDDKLRFEVAKQILSYQTSYVPLESTYTTTDDVKEDAFSKAFGVV